MLSLANLIGSGPERVGATGARLPDASAAAAIYQQILTSPGPTTNHQLQAVAATRLADLQQPAAPLPPTPLPPTPPLPQPHALSPYPMPTPMQQGGGPGGGQVGGILLPPAGHQHQQSHQQSMQAAAMAGEW